jgi:hypothetical protein
MSKIDFTLNVAPEMLAALFVGAVVDVSQFPYYKEMPTLMQSEPGKYFVDSVILHSDHTVEIGIADEKTHEHVDYFDFKEIHLRVISPGIFNFGSVR